MSSGSRPKKRLRSKLMQKPAHSQPSRPETEGGRILQELPLQELDLQGFRFPLEEGYSVSIRCEADHALFLRCCELYRVIDLLQRQSQFMVDSYSKFRTRTQFDEVLSYRFFDVNEGLVARMNPALSIRVFSLFNYIHEFRIALAYTDAMPVAVKTQIDVALVHLCRGWEALRGALREALGWNFKAIQP